jgi:hypothetical protein
MYLLLFRKEFSQPSAGLVHHTRETAVEQSKEECRGGITRICGTLTRADWNLLSAVQRLANGPIRKKRQLHFLPPKYYFKIMIIDISNELYVEEQNGAMNTACCNIKL